MTPRAIHMIGIGGAGMSGLARLAAQAGYSVSGTDRSDSAVLADLRALGVDARAGHGADALPAATEAVVVSTAIAEDNPDLVAAQRRGIPIIHRADLLAELMRSRRGLAVAGAHGKSTTSGMLTLALGSPSACVGATIPGGGGTGAVWGDGPWFVAEADESDRSLLKLAPEAAILLNVDHDHHTTYATLAEVEDVFRDFVGRLPAEGVVVAGPQALARQVAGAAVCPVHTVGYDPDDTWRIVHEPDGGATLHHERTHVPLRLAVPGRHNVENAACALALASWCGVDPDLAASRLEAFTGVGRRFELKGSVGGVTVIDDYAHHPAELQATLSAARERHPGRLIAVFQPHLYSRTKALKNQIAAALGGADVAIVTDIYAAREPFDPSIDSADLVALAPGAILAPTLAEAADAVMQIAAPGDMVLTLGAGDITTLGQELIARLQRPS